MNSRILTLTAGIFMASLTASADVTDEMRALIDDGDYEKAVKIGAKSFEEGPDAASLGQLNELMGEALWNIRGRRGESAEYFQDAAKKGVADAYLYLARQAMLDYDFPTAQKYYGDYKRLKQKAKKPLDEDYEYELEGLEEGKRQFERVRELVVIDAVPVDRRDFFKKIRVPASAGVLKNVSELPLPDGVERGEMAFTSESGDLMIWTEVNDSTGYAGIAEANILADGTLSPTRYAPEFLSEDGDAQYPFLTADGATLYYASDGEGSIGGYDIFMAGRDPRTGEYLQPVNMGIPFNSAADDYMLVIDEENGVGWWATDRHFLSDDRIMLYVYLLQDERKNVESGDEDKRARSKLDNIRVTWTPSQPEDGEEIPQEYDENGYPINLTTAGPAEDHSEEYISMAEEIRKIEPGKRKRKDSDLKIMLPGGKAIYSEDDVDNREAKTIVTSYFDAEKLHRKNLEKLAEMRREYGKNPSAELGTQIRSMENITAREKTMQTKLLSQLYRSLGMK